MGRLTLPSMAQIRPLQPAPARAAPRAGKGTFQGILRGLAATHDGDSLPSGRRRPSSDLLRALIQPLSGRIEASGLPDGEALEGAFSAGTYADLA